MSHPVESGSGETAFVAFGSNQGDRIELCDRAVTLLGLLPHSRVTGVSSFYETQPVVDERTDPGPSWFINGIVRLVTALPVRRLFAICREVEQALGRDQDQRGGPRSMDLDLLFFGSAIVHEEDLVIPHPRLHLRRFVLVPMVELDPEWRHPVLGKTMRALLAEVHDESAVRRLEHSPGAGSGFRPGCSPSPAV
ncbi:2-amino-4-hydroxy-6-hydroxymethyldihydropteridine diphosphokinase [Candidatus Nitrospira bockiana]